MLKLHFFIYRRSFNQFFPFNNKKASDFDLTSSLVTRRFFKFNIQEWTDVALDRQFCSALLYILTQDINLATVFAANF